MASYPKEILGLKLERTCSCCPEQYDVFDGDKQVGYLRLRHGWFYAAYPDVGGEHVYEKELTEEEGDGIFDDTVREYYLIKAVKAIKRKVDEEEILQKT